MTLGSTSCQTTKWKTHDFSFILGRKSEYWTPEHAINIYSMKPLRLQHWPVKEINPTLAKQGLCVLSQAQNTMPDTVRAQNTVALVFITVISIQHFIPSRLFPYQRY